MTINSPYQRHAIIPIDSILNHVLDALVTENCTLDTNAVLSTMVKYAQYDQETNWFDLYGTLDEEFCHFSEDSRQVLIDQTRALARIFDLCLFKGGLMLDRVEVEVFFVNVQSDRTIIIGY